MLMVRYCELEGTVTDWWNVPGDTAGSVTVPALELSLVVLAQMYIHAGITRVS